MSTKPDQQGWNAAFYGRHARFVGQLGAPVVELLAPKRGERILDLGCGDGYLTAQIAQTGADVLGIDASADMVAASRAAGLEARVTDGQALPFRAEFDAVFSNAALHWMPDLDAVFAGVRAALKPGGRFVAEMGGQGNVAAVATAIRAVLQRRGLSLPDRPWNFPSPEGLRRRLDSAGFRVETLEWIPRPTRLDTGLGPWLENFASHLLAIAPKGDRAEIAGEIEALLAPTLRDEEGIWFADYVRLRFAAFA